jgi:hypothetical protein
MRVEVSAICIGLGKRCTSTPLDHLTPAMFLRICKIEIDSDFL